jgi:hypothetical protein
MSLPNFTSQAVTSGNNVFNGGLNSTAGPLGLQDNESSDLQNIDFNKFGSIFPRNGYTQLNTATNGASTQFDGLHWYEAIVSGSEFRKLIGVGNSKIIKMDDLDGTWDDITGGLTITDDNHWTFANFLNKVYATNGTDAPWEWAGTGNASASTLPTNVTVPKFCALYNNYMFYAHVKVSNVLHNSRIYWSALKDTSSWLTTNFIDVAKDDGQEITGIKVLADRLVVYKTRSVYNLFYTGDTDIPFILPGGGKTNSSVGCIAPDSIQEVNNGHVFLSHDGFYFFDGSNAYKISDRITTTLLGFNTTRFYQAVSLVQRDKNRYMCALPDSGETDNSKVLVWDYFNNAWSVYDGINASAMATVYENGDEERIYFGDYGGFAYRADNGTNDNPAGVETAVDAYYWTNWRHFGDLINQKGVPELTIFYQSSDSILTLSYSYDFTDGAQFSQTFSLDLGGAQYDSAIYDIDVYAASGGAVKRRDLTGRGRVVRFRFSNNVLGETFQIDGIGTLAHLETNA